jgi:hypothetical protein
MLSMGKTYQVKNRYFHHALIEVRRPILDHFDSNNFLGSEILALNHLAESTLAEYV